MASNKSAGVMPAMDDYQAQDDVRTLTRAEEIKADKKRHGKAKAHAKKMLSQLQSVSGKSDNDADDKK
jgi:hypothetical protein